MKQLTFKSLQIKRELELILSCSCSGFNCTHAKNVKQLKEELV